MAMLIGCYTNAHNIKMWQRKYKRNKYFLSLISHKNYSNNHQQQHQKFHSNEMHINGNKINVS